MKTTLQEWNTSVDAVAIESLLSCCAALRWAEGVAAIRPYTDAQALFEAADAIWSTMQEPDWMEAFRAHPRIGERKAAAASAQSVKWSNQEQDSVSTAAEQVLNNLAELNAIYEERFGFTYIVRATGKSAGEMLAILERRLDNNREIELQNAAEQQRQIMQIRLKKWLHP